MKLPLTDTHFKSTDWDQYQLPQYRRALAVTKHRRTAIDCGAHVGIFTHRLAEEFAWVHAFEPIHMDLLKANTAHYNNIMYYPFAVGDEPTTVQMNTNSTNSGDNRVADTGEFTVEQIAIDDLGVEDVDFVKMDIQDRELWALKGAEHTIRTYRPTLLIEIEPTNPTKYDILDLLKDWGYTIDSIKNADHTFLTN